MTDGFREDRAQAGDRPIGIGVGLEVGDIWRPCPSFFSVPGLAASICAVTDSMAGDAKSPDPPALQKIHPPVPASPSRVGTGHASVQGELIYLLSKLLFQFIIQGMIRFTVPVHRAPPFRLFSFWIIPGKREYFHKNCLEPVKSGSQK